MTTATQTIYDDDHNNDNAPIAGVDGGNDNDAANNDESNDNDSNDHGDDEDEDDNDHEPEPEANSKHGNDDDTGDDESQENLSNDDASNNGSIENDDGNAKDWQDDTRANNDSTETDADEAHWQLIISQEMDAKYGPRTDTYSLQPQKPRSFTHQHPDIAALHHAIKHPVSEIILTQYGAKKGLKVFGEAGTEAVIKELKQLHDRGMMVPRDPKALSWEEKWRALQYLMVEVFWVEGNWLIVLTYHCPQLGMAGIGMNFER